MSIKFVKEGQASFQYQGSNLFAKPQPVYYKRYVVEGKKNGVYPEVVDTFIHNSLTKFPLKEKFVYAVNALFPKLGKNKWRMGLWAQWNKVETVSVLVRDSVEQENCKIKMFDLFFRKPPHAVAGSDEKRNDCVYNAILTALADDKSKMPRHLRKRSDFKKFFNVGRNDKIPMDQIHLLQNEFSKTSISICGDYIYMPKKVKAKHISLKCTGEHITLMCNKGRDKTVNVSFKNHKPEKIATITLKEKSFKYYDGTYHTVSYEEYRELKNEYLFVFVEKESDLESKRLSYLEQAKTLFEASKGVVNYYRACYDRLVGLESWRLLSKNISEPDELSVFEQYVLDVAYRGGFKYISAGTYKNVVDIDMNAMYAYYMKSISFYLPVKAPELKTFDETTFNELKFYPFGMYHCVLKGDHPFFDQRLNDKPSWFTHYDLQLYILLNVNIKIVIDDSCNSLLYPSESRVSGKDMFGSWVDFMYKLKEEGHDVKMILSTLHGAMCKKIIANNRINLNKNEVLNVDGLFVEGITHVSEDLDIIRTVDKVNIFQYKYARVGAFLTSYCRLKIVQLLLKHCQPENVHYVNTDGFIIDKKYEKCFPISSKLGEFKIAKDKQGNPRTGNVNIKNHQSITFS